MDLSLVKNFADVIDLGAAALGDRDMIVLGDDRLSWNNIQARAGQTANALAADGVFGDEELAVFYAEKGAADYRLKAPSSSASCSALLGRVTLRRGDRLAAERFWRQAAELAIQERSPLLALSCARA